MENKRGYNRYRTRSYCAVYNRENNESMGCLVDLSRDGLKIMGEKSLPEDKIYKLKIVMHKVIDGSRMLELDARCLWNKQSFDPNFYISGFKLVNSDKKLLERVVLFTRTSAFHYPDTLKIKVK